MDYWKKTAIASSCAVFGGVLSPVLAGFILCPLGQGFLINVVYKILKDKFKLGKASLNSLGDKQAKLICVTSCMAKLANIDGLVSRQEIKLIEDILREEFNLNNKAVDHFFEIFDSAVKDEATLAYYVEIYRNMINSDYNTSINFVYLLLSLAHIDGEYSTAEENAIKETINILHLPSNTYEQTLFDYKFDQMRQEMEIKGCGTGFFINSSGYLVTNCHVIETSKKIKVRTSHNSLNADIISTDEENDLCLLHIDNFSCGLPFFAEKIITGQEVLTYGYPQPDLQGFVPKMTQGIVSSTSGFQDDYRFFQIDAAIQPGNSGGPLIDKKNGSLLGVISLSMKKSQNVNYAIKSEILFHFLQQIPGVENSIKFNTEESINIETINERLSQSTVQVFSCK